MVIYLAIGLCHLLHFGAHQKMVFEQNVPSKLCSIFFNLKRTFNTSGFSVTGTGLPVCDFRIRKCKLNWFFSKEHYLQLILFKKHVPTINKWGTPKVQEKFLHFSFWNISGFSLCSLSYMSEARMSFRVYQGVIGLPADPVPTVSAAELYILWFSKLSQ